MLGALSFLLSGGGVAQLGTIVEELNKVMSGREDRLRAPARRRSTDVVGTLDDQKADIIRALESMNNLTATLNPRSRRSPAPSTSPGRPIEVLADQHDELVAMLARAGPARRGRHPGDQGQQGRPAQVAATTCSRCWPSCAAAGDELAPGLNLLVSFPFPKEASEIVRGDYANTSIRADISLENFLPAARPIPDLPIPDIPLPDLPTRRRGAQRRPEVPAERQPHQRGLQEGAGRPRPARPS